MKKHYWLYIALTLTFLLAVWANPIHADIPTPLPRNPVGYEYQRNNSQIHFWNEKQDFYVDSNGLNLSQQLRQDGSVSEWAQYNWCLRVPTLQGIVERCARNFPARSIIISTDGLNSLDINSTIIFSFINGGRSFQFETIMNYHLNSDSNYLGVNLFLKNKSNFVLNKEVHLIWKLESIKLNDFETDNSLWVIDGQTTERLEDGTIGYVNSIYDLSTINDLNINKVFGSMLRFRHEPSSEEMWFRWQIGNPLMNNAKLRIHKEASNVNANVDVDFNLTNVPANSLLSLQMDWVQPVGCAIDFNGWERNSRTLGSEYNCNGGNCDANFLVGNGTPETDWNYGQSPNPLRVMRWWNNEALCATLSCPPPSTYGLICRVQIGDKNTTNVAPASNFVTLYQEGLLGGTQCSKWADCPNSTAPNFLNGCPFKMPHDINRVQKFRQFDQCNTTDDEGITTILVNDIIPITFLYNTWKDKSMPIIQVQPYLIDVQQSLSCVYSDADGDKPKPIGVYDVNWFQNGTRVVGQDGNVFASNLVLPGAMYYCAENYCDDTNIFRAYGCPKEVIQRQGSVNVSLAAWPSTDVVIPEKDSNVWFWVLLLVMVAFFVVILYRRRT